MRDSDARCRILHQRMGNVVITNIRWSGKVTARFSNFFLSLIFVPYFAVENTSDKHLEHLANTRVVAFYEFPMQVLSCEGVFLYGLRYECAFNSA
jgi:hypothetical protein